MRRPVGSPVEEKMRSRTVLGVAALLLPLLLATGCGPVRYIVSGKLDASQGFDFSCSVVNKSPTDTIEVTIALKEGNGDIYIDPSTFQPAILTQMIGPREAAMLVQPAAFVGVTSLYCWADVPMDSTVFGTFLVRDAQERATAATPLVEDVNQAGLVLGGELQEIENLVDQLVKLEGPVTGGTRVEVCQDAVEAPPNSSTGLNLVAACPAGQMATGGGCEVSSAGGDPSLFTNYRSSAPTSGATDWQCSWRNTSAWTENVNLCAYAICVDSGGAD